MGDIYLKQLNSVNTILNTVKPLVKKIHLIPKLKYKRKNIKIIQFTQVIGTQIH